jgi:4-carboxymuconolactone decarboxylase
MDRTEERYQRGLALQRKMFARPDATPRPASPVARLKPELSRLNTEIIFGEIWSRPELDLRSRSLITVAAMVALGKESELRPHLLAALNNGLTKDELTELIMHLTYYIGVPTAVAAFQIAEQVFQEVGVAP